MTSRVVHSPRELSHFPIVERFLERFLADSVDEISKVLRTEFTETLHVVPHLSGRELFQRVLSQGYRTNARCDDAIDDDLTFGRREMVCAGTSFREALLGLLTKSLGSFCLAAASLYQPSRISCPRPAAAPRCRAPGVYAAHVPALLQLALLVRCCETNR